MMNLSVFAVNALNHKASVARDTYDPADPESRVWMDVARQCREVARRGSIAALQEAGLAKRELEDYLGGDLPEQESRAIVRDLCRAGWFPIFNPNAVCSRRIKRRRVDGQWYETGY